MSHYTEEHMYTHTSLATQISLHLYACTQVFTTHTTNIYAHGLSHIYTVVGESYANTIRGRHRGLHPPPPLLYLGQPFKMYQGRLSILLPRSLRRFAFMLNSLNLIFVSHAASEVKSAVSVNSMGYSTEHTSVPQFIAQLLISSFIYV